MSCVRPLTAYWRDVSRSAVTFDKNKSSTKISFGLPCGQCIGCRLEKARQWGMRCLHEKKMWTHNAYVTLTYSEEFLPEGNTLVLRDLQLFMKRLRKAKEGLGDVVEINGKLCRPLRFFAGGEYGEENGRPHYHLLLFNCDFPDKLFFTFNKRGEPLYSSPELAQLWGLGHCTIGEVTFDSAVYCAKYALKKVNGDLSKEHYEFIDEDGIVYDRKPEFAVMSRRPGIGRTYVDKYISEIVSHDNVIINGREVRAPRYYEIRASEVEEEAMLVHSRRRKRLAVLNRADNTPERLRVKEKLMVIAAEQKERKL